MNTILAILCTLFIWPVIIFGPYYLAKFLLVNLLKHLPPPKDAEKVFCWLIGCFITLILGGLLYTSFMCFNFINNLISGV